MNICLIGENLSSLALAKNLVNKKIKVFFYYHKNKKFFDKNRTIGISKSNLDFFNKEIIKIKENKVWKINEIDIYSEKFKKNKILNFKKKNEELFSIIKNYQIYESLEKNLKKNKLFKRVLIKNNNFYKKILKEDKYQLIINCDENNLISKNFFYKKVFKDYNSNAYATIIKHKKCQNRKAVQIFTKKGPIAFLPISKLETSIVFSKINEPFFLNEDEIKKLLNKYSNYEIKSFSKLEKFNLNLSFSRNFYYKNIMLFGGALYRVHPLAGQGFNMIIRDIKILSKIIQDRLDLGLALDHLIYKEFEKKTKSYNFIFVNGIDFIHNFFQFDNSYKNNFINQILEISGKNKILNKYISRYADTGMPI